MFVLFGIRVRVMLYVLSGISLLCLLLFCVVVVRYWFVVCGVLFVACWFIVV